MTNLYENNPGFQEIYRKDETVLYAPVQTASYHMSRYVAAGEQNIYSASGATKEYLDKLTGQMLDIVNTGSKDRIISDIAVLCNNLRYRMKYPVDADCAIRMAAIYAILPDEPADKCELVYINRKLELAQKDPDLYSFFLSMGVASTPSWKESLMDLEPMNEYLKNRAAVLQGLTITT